MLFYAVGLAKLFSRTWLISTLYICFWIESCTPENRVFDQNNNSTQSGETIESLENLFYDLCWIAYSPTSFDPTVNPPQWPSKETVRNDLKVLSESGFTGLVTYSAKYFDRDDPSMLIDIPALAQSVGFQGMIIGVWDPSDEEELKAAELSSQYNLVLGYSVGNEGLDVRYDLSVLKTAMERLRRTTQRPVTTTEEIYDYYINSPLWEISDWIFPNVHPYFNGLHEPQKAVDWTRKVFLDLDSISSKATIFKEVGLPTVGDPKIGERGQFQYYKLLKETEVNYVIFEAFDAPWKTLPVGQAGNNNQFPDPESHWGVFNSNRAPKYVVNITCSN